MLVDPDGATASRRLVDIEFAIETNDLDAGQLTAFGIEVPGFNGHGAMHSRKISPEDSRRL